MAVDLQLPNGGQFMYNDWLTIGKFTIHGYGVMIAIGILFGFAFGERQAKKHGLNSEYVDNIIFIALIAGYACAKLTYVLVNWETFLSNPKAVLGSGGWVVYGGVLGGILAAYIYCRIKKVNFMDYFNLMLPGVSLAQGFGRIGCFFAGCCYGVETHSHFGVTFPAHSLAPAGVPLVPTQLLSSLGDFIIFLVLYRMYENEKTRKYTGAGYLVLYSLGRFMIEFLRGDIERGSIGILSTSQFIAIFTALAGVALILKIRSADHGKPTNMVE